MYVIKNSQSIYNIRPTCQSRCFLKVLIFKSKVVIIYGIEKGDNDEIKKAHHIKIRDFHSDRNVGVTDAVREILEQKAAEINHARDVLLKL